MVDGTGTAGGGEGIARQIAIHLDRARFEVTFCATRWEPDPSDEAGFAELRAAGVGFHGLQRSSRLDLGSWWELVSLARRRGVDVIHTHKFGSNVWGALLAPLIGAPVFVAHEHTWSYQGNPRRVFLDRQLIARRADVFIAVSREDQRRMVEVEKIPPAKTRFIPNGIPSFPAPTPGRDVRAELGLGAEQPLIGAVATLRPQKALDVLIRALALIREEIPEAALVIIGGDDTQGGPEQQRLSDLAERLGVDGAVRLLGERFDVPDFVASFDVAALSSDFEGSPLSVMEYMEAAKPVVATAVGGVPDLIEDGVSGLLVSPQDPPALASALSALLRDRTRAAEMGAAGRLKRRREFSIEATADQVGALYEELLAAKVRDHSALMNAATRAHST